MDAYLWGSVAGVLVFAGWSVVSQVREYRRRLSFVPVVAADDPKDDSRD